MIDLSRYLSAHKESYENALREIKQGYKRTHWVWFIFPQIYGLGMSPTAKYYEIKSIEEAQEFLNNEILGAHLIEICEALLTLDNDNPREILGYPDDLKLKSSMTLFNYIKPNDVFKKVLDKFYDGEEDDLTLATLHIEKTKQRTLN